MNKTLTTNRAGLGALAAPKHLAFLRAAFDVVLRADATVAATSTSGWIEEISSDAFGAFLRDLQPFSGASRLIQLAQPASIGAHSQVNYPNWVGGPSTVPSFVAEGGAIPLKPSEFGTVSIGPRKKLAHMIVYSNELARRSDAFNIFSLMVRQSVAAELDGAVFSTDVGSASVHAGLLYGVTATSSPSSGAKADLSALAASVSNGGSGNVTFITTPTLFAQLKIAEPAIAGAIDIVPSAALPAGRVIAADAASLLFAVDPSPEVTTSKNAAVHMSTVPLELVNASGVVADPLRSAFQTDSTVLKVVQNVAWAKARTGSVVAYLDGASW